MTVSLETAALDAGYTKGRPVVRGLDLTFTGGEVTALLGPNGAGKTTVMLTLAGLLPRLGGTVTVGGTVLPVNRPRGAAKAGVVLVPDDRSLFTGLTVRENLSLARRRGGTNLEQVLDYFPALRERLKVNAGMLSGGEQQQLAIGRALMQNPRVLLIDELSMGLAPIVVEKLMPIIRQVATGTGAAVVLVEQHVKLALATADRAVVLAHGTSVLQGDAKRLLDSPEALEQAYLGGRTSAAV